MSIVLTVNGSKCEDSFLIAPDQNRTFPVRLGLSTDDGSTVNATLKVAPGGAGIEFEKTEVSIGPGEMFVNMHATSASNSRRDTTLQVMVGDTIQSTCALTAITDVRMWFKGRFQARFATNNDPGTDKRGVVGSTIALAGEGDFDRVIRFHNPVDLRSHVEDRDNDKIKVTIVSISGKLAGSAAGNEEFFDVGDALIGQPVDLGPGSYFVGNCPPGPNDGNVERHGDGAEPIDKFEFHIGSWFSGRSATADDRPKTDLNPFTAFAPNPCKRGGTIFGVDPPIEAYFGIPKFVDFRTERSAQLKDDFDDLTPEQQQGMIGTNLRTRRSRLATIGSLGYGQSLWYKGLVNDAINFSPNPSTVLAYFDGIGPLNFSAHFFNFVLDDLCGRVYGYVAPTSVTLVNPFDHILNAAAPPAAVAGGAFPVRRLRVLSQRQPRSPIQNNEMQQEDAQRHCMMVSQEGGEGLPSWATIWYLDWLDASGVPFTEDLASQYEGFQMLGENGWKLVQVVEKPASDGMNGSVPAQTHFYFTRPARGKS